jgi:hypothetical protein
LQGILLRGEAGFSGLDAGPEIAVSDEKDVSVQQLLQKIAEYLLVTAPEICVDHRFEPGNAKEIPEKVAHPVSSFHQKDPNQYLLEVIFPQLLRVKRRERPESALRAAPG